MKEQPPFIKIGDKFNQLTVIAENGKASNGNKKFKCICECGNVSTVRKSRLLSGHTKSCGCAGIIDLLGLRFGLLTVASIYGRDKCGQVLWLCKCDCGGEHILDGARLRTGAMDNCGCLTSKRLSEGKKTHDMAGSRIYNIWAGMKYRCQDIDDERYGGRGINYDPQWKQFENFYRDIGDPPTNNHEIDRINNNKGYSKDNCRWTTRRVNTTNTRRSRIWIVDGVEFNTMHEAIIKTGLSRWKIQDRCHREIYNCSTILKYERLNDE